MMNEMVRENNLIDSISHVAKWLDDFNAANIERRLKELEEIEQKLNQEVIKFR